MDIYIKIPPHGRRNRLLFVTYDIITFPDTLLTDRLNMYPSV